MNIDNELLVPLGVFVAMTLGAWGVLGLVAGRQRFGEHRLKRLLDPRAAENIHVKRQLLVQAKVTAAASKLGESLRPTDEEEAGKIRIKLLNAGCRQEQAVPIYYGIKVICLLIGLAGAFPACVLRYGMTQMSYLIAIVTGGLAFYLPDLIVGRLTKSRSEAIFLGLPDALDLMVVCVEAGLGLDAAMRRVTSELSQSCPVICEEFAIANFQLQMGRPRRGVLRDLGIRTGVDDLRSLAGVIIQAEKFGSSIAAALRAQSDTMRLRRRQMAEERAAQTSVKIMLPLIFFIFPGVFVVTVGPAALRLANIFTTK
jgi:tight adherence protein C